MAEQSNIVESRVQMVSSAPLAAPVEVLGAGILAHLLALHFGVLGRGEKQLLACHTIRSYSLVYGNVRRMAGYRNAWLGKAFEYAVVELYNRRAEPYYSLIQRGLAQTIESRVSKRVKSVTIALDRLSCVRVAKEAIDSENLIEHFGRFRILEDARRSLKSATSQYADLHTKVDLLFCDRANAVAQQFAVTASVKVNRESFLTLPVQRDFSELPLDIAISLSTARYREVGYEKHIPVPVVYLPLDDVDNEMVAWTTATQIVEKALLEADRNVLIRWFVGFFKRGSAENYWVEFLANRMEMDILALIEEIRGVLKDRVFDRVTSLPVLLGTDDDAVIDLLPSVP